MAPAWSTRAAARASLSARARAVLLVVVEDGSALWACSPRTERVHVAPRGLPPGRSKRAFILGKDLLGRVACRRGRRPSSLPARGNRVLPDSWKAGGRPRPPPPCR